MGRRKPTKAKSFVEKIIDEINRLLIDKYPSHTVYIDLCPVKFDRPAFLIELITIIQNSVNRRTVQETVYFTITCFDKTDDYAHSSTLDLIAVQQGIMGIFKKGYVRVDKRAIEVKASTGGRNFDRAYIDLQFEYFDSRPGVQFSDGSSDGSIEDENLLLKMKDIYMKIEEE